MRSLALRIRELGSYAATHLSKIRPKTMPIEPLQVVPTKTSVRQMPVMKSAINRPRSRSENNLIYLNHQLTPTPGLILHKSDAYPFQRLYNPFKANTKMFASPCRGVQRFFHIGTISAGYVGDLSIVSRTA
jgi:hypothetical protein